jgi:biotin synthase
LGLKKTEETGILFDLADETRRKFCGEGVLLRGFLAFSNVCDNACAYCGFSRRRQDLVRYRMMSGEVLRAVGLIAAHGIKTVVLQAGEDADLDAGWLADLVHDIKAQADCAVTLCVGEREAQDYRRWRLAGADRYLLKIETSDRQLYERFHPGMSFDRRLECLRTLNALGYQTGSGILVGLPGQSLLSLAKDILFFHQENFDMIGIAPFVPHAQTPLRGGGSPDAALTLKVLALTRIVTRDTHLPVTTALGSVSETLRTDALSCGANVVMPDFTPSPYRALYDIYPGRTREGSPMDGFLARLEAQAAAGGRALDRSVGDSLKLKSHV